MIDEERKKEAKNNFIQYLQDGLIKKEKNETAKAMYIKNADLSLSLAEECMNSSLKPYIWIVTISYYSMFYIANAVLLELGYKTGDKIVHKVTNDSLIVLVMDKIKKELLEEYENAKDDALEIASIKSDEIITSYGLEMSKRSRFQYDMTEAIKEQKANTSLKRARQFVFEMKKLLPLFKKQ
ncbi:hypothetical protein J4404_02485 [Candidatus Woesearchaeota archaeon]|nr:hypothetical protein [Candidatus Woesearchaeota archaeon]